MLLNNYYLLMPEIYLSTIIVFLLAFGVFYTKIGGRYNKFYKFNYLSILALIWTFILVMNINIEGIKYIGEINWFEINTLNLWIKGIVLLSTIGVFWITWNSYTQYKISEYEYALIILLSLLGILLIISSKDLILIYLSIELISLSLYVLAGIKRKSGKSTEAGLKYFILGALSSGVLLFGMAIIYSTLGTTNIIEMKELAIISTEVKIGGIFLTSAILFKLAAAPLHMWAPDVYEGAPTVVTSYFAIVPKIGLLYILYEILFEGLIAIYGPVLQTLIMISAILSIAAGTFGAISQNRIVRLMAYSAVAHMGFILLGFTTGTLNGVIASFVYIIIYIIMSINTFGILLSLYKGVENKYIEDIKGLGKQQPVIAITLAMTLLSIAGIPPLAGFLSKFYVILSVIENNQILLPIIAITLSVVASYYYLKIIKSMYFEQSSLITTRIMNKVSKVQGIILGMTTYLILTILINPEPIIIWTVDSIINSIV